MLDIHCQGLEIYTSVSDRHENVDLGINNSRESWFTFLNWSITFLSKKHVIFKPRKQRFTKRDTAFKDEIIRFIYSKNIR